MPPEVQDVMSFYQLAGALLVAFALGVVAGVTIGFSSGL